MRVVPLPSTTSFYAVREFLMSFLSIVSTVRVFSFFLFMVSFSVFSTECPEHYWQGKEPSLTIPLQRNQELCFQAFAIGYTYTTKNALYAVEHLTDKNLKKAKKLDRDDSFHEETALPEYARAVLSDYKGSGFDRGHLAPNADMPTRKAQYESFSLANMVPQLHANNAGIWSRIESHVRDITLDNKDVFVVTGGIYNATKVKIGKKIAVPNAMFKAVYIPSKQTVGVYFSENTVDGDYSLISLEDLKKMTGLSVFPTLEKKLGKKIDRSFLISGNTSHSKKSSEQPALLSILKKLLR